MKAERLFLGIDGGASNITAVVIDQDQRVLYQQTTAGGANYHSIGLVLAIEHLEEVVQLTVDHLDCPAPIVFDRAVFGLAGCDFDSDKSVLSTALRKSSLSTWLSQGFEVMNDTHIALYAGVGDAVGVVLIAGTGSSCYARNQQAQEARAGGVDYLLSDEGSAYDMGLRLLRAVTRALDGRSDQTLLVSMLFALLQVADLASLYQVIYQQYTSKHKIASLAGLVGAAADKGDQVALDIIHHSVNELLKLVDAVTNRLALQDQPISIIRIGSVFHNQYLTKRLENELIRIVPKAKLVEPHQSSAVGAALMAMTALKG